MVKRIVNNIISNYNLLINNPTNRHFFLLNENHSENNPKTENKFNKIKQLKFIIHKIIFPLFSKIEKNNNFKGDRYQFGYQNESYKNQNSKNKSIKVSLLKKNMYNLFNNFHIK